MEAEKHVTSPEAAITSRAAEKPVDFWTPTRGGARLGLRSPDIRDGEAQAWSSVEADGEAWTWGSVRRGS